MKLTLSEPKYIKESITIISELVNEARFKISSDAIEMIAMDPANVAMVVFKLFSSSFIEYKVEKPIEIGINLNNLKSILKRAKGNDTLTMELDNNKLNIILKSSSTRTFSMPLIDIEEREQKVPDLSFKSIVEMPCSSFNDIIEDVDVVAESVTFLTEPSKLTVQAEGDLSKAKIELKENNDIKIKVIEPSKAKYSIEYLKKMMLGSKLSEKVNLYFSRDYPIKLEFKEIDKVMLTFILAPRVDND